MEPNVRAVKNKQPKKYTNSAGKGFHEFLQSEAFGLRETETNQRNEFQLGVCRAVI